MWSLHKWLALTGRQVISQILLPLEPSMMATKVGNHLSMPSLVNASFYPWGYHGKNESAGKPDGVRFGSCSRWDSHLNLARQNLVDVNSSRFIPQSCIKRKPEIVSVGLKRSRFFPCFRYFSVRNTSAS